VLAAREAAQRGQWKIVEGYRSRLAGHSLEAYPWYWMLQGSVDRVDPREVRAFLDRYPGTPLAEGLRREWLRALGAAASWEVFRAEYPKVVGDDAEITCYSFQERLARSDPEVMAEARSLFVSHRESGVACDNVFAALASSGRITETEAWERLRAMLADGNVKEARRAAALLPPRSAINEKQLERVARDPGAFLAREKAGKAVPRAEQELLVFAVERLARSKPDEAAERLMALTPRLEPQAVRHAWGQVAWQGALNHHPRALEWYSQVGTTALTDTQIAWRARACLRAGDWKEVLASIQALSPEQQREPTWRYWRARALRQLGEAPAGELLLRGIAGQQTFYGILAAEELGIAAAPEWNGFRPQPTDLDRVRAIEGIQRALALYRIGLDPEALREWMWAIRGLDDRGLLAARSSRARRTRSSAPSTPRTAPCSSTTSRSAFPRRIATRCRRRRASGTWMKPTSTASSARKAASWPMRARASAPPASCSSCRRPRAGSRVRWRSSRTSPTCCCSPTRTCRWARTTTAACCRTLDTPCSRPRRTTPGLGVRAAGATNGRSRAPSTRRPSPSTKRATT
jgi:soluble lytic murein transglycosylase